MKLVSTIAAIIVCASICSSCGTRSNTTGRANAPQLTENEKHRLYAAALAASDSPLDSDLFKTVCQKIEIFDASGKPTQHYMSFISDHIQWSMEPANREFGHEINTPEKARQYISQHLAG